MKFYHFYKLSKLIFFISCVIISNYSSIANENNYLDEKVKKITSLLRCMTCQNQTIYDSDSDFSKDIKKIVRQKLLENEKEQEIINFLITRYGEYIVFKPQINIGNMFLWQFPFIILAFSLFYLLYMIKKNQKN